jgi:chromosome segregation ATPase
MYISELKVEKFHLFGEGENAALLRLRPGLTAIVGENDSGKSHCTPAGFTNDWQRYRCGRETDF